MIKFDEIEAKKFKNINKNQHLIFYNLKIIFHKRNRRRFNNIYKII